MFLSAISLLAANVLFGDNASINDSKSTDAGQNHSLQDLCAQSGGIYKAYLGALQQRLAMVAPKSAHEKKRKLVYK